MYKNVQKLKNVHFWYEIYQFSWYFEQKWEKVPFMIKIEIIGHYEMAIWVSIWLLEQKKGGQLIQHQFYKRQVNQLSTNHIQGKYVGVFPGAKMDKNGKKDYFTKKIQKS